MPVIFYAAGKTAKTLVLSTSITYQQGEGGIAACFESCRTFLPTGTKIAEF